jgi:Holliday junction DNA helicase RuvA
MIAHLSGKLLTKTSTQSVVDCHGVGYEVFHTPFTAEKMTGENISLFIHSNIREDAFQLFGFFSSEERAVFRELLRVNGVGPKLAISILSGISYQDLMSALLSKDMSRLQKIPGIGKKTAERLTVELSDRLPQIQQSISLPDFSRSSGSKESELESVLTNLGYQRPEILRALKSVRGKETEFENLSLENLVKVTLRELTQSRPN